MKAGFEAAGLIALLFVVTLALGLGFGGTGLAGTLSNPGISQVLAGRGGSVNPPTLIIRAEGINPAYLYDSASFLTVPTFMLVPLRDLQIALVQESQPLARNPLHPEIRVVFTNSSGMAEAIVSPGNYTVSVKGSIFAFNTTLTFRSNSTTTLDFRLLPQPTKLSSINVVSPDSISGIESASELYATVAGGTRPTQGFAEIVGLQSSNAGAGGQLEVNGTVVGTHPGGGETWVAISPSGAFIPYPTYGLFLFQYRPSAQVTYTAG